MTTDPTNVQRTQKTAGGETPSKDAVSTAPKARVFRYPNNLDTNEQPHSVNFFISEYAPGASAQSIAANNAALNDELGAPSARGGNGITAENASAINQSLRFGVAFVSALAAQKAAGAVTDSKILKGIAATVTAKLVDNKVSQKASSIQTAPVKRIKEAISLHIAQSPQAKYSAEYENESIGAILGGIATGGGGAGALASITEAAASGQLTELIARGMVDAATLPKELGLGNVNLGGLARAASKKVRNPYQEQIFKTMNFRTFAFQYKFAPRNKSEFDEVQSIINLFKYHMHPTKADDGAFFLFPSIFDIEYRYKGERNTFVNRIATSVLTDMSVDYGSEGVFTTFRGTKGAPSEITLAMQFREISLLTKGENGELTNGTGAGY